MNATTSTNFRTEPINENYEWMYYNNRLRIIHSINDDMFHMKSIVDALHPTFTREPRKWLDLQETKELIAGFNEEMCNAKIGGTQKMVEKRDLSNDLRGYYCHRLLVNIFASWVCPRYAFYIALLLDDYFEKQRKQLQNQIAQIKPRCVPKNKEKNYKYMIYMSDVLPDDENTNEDMIELHLVKRNNHTFHVMSKIKNSDKCWFYRENLPVAMTPNEDIKNIVRKELKGTEYDIKGSSIITYREHLDLLKEKITEYFDNFQK